MVLVPIGIFLIEKARKDSQIFNKELYFRIWRKSRSFLNLNLGRLKGLRGNKEGQKRENGIADSEI
jgi:hypothetical protein